MKNLALLLALTIAACADLPEDRAPSDTEQDAVELGSTEQALSFPAPYKVLLGVLPPTGWSTAQASTWYLAGNPTKNPARYFPGEAATGQTTEKVWSPLQAVGTTCSSPASTPGSSSLCKTSSGTSYRVTCPTLQQPRTVIGYVQAPGGTYVQGWPSNTAMGSYGTNVNASHAGGYSFNGRQGVQCTYTWNDVQHDIFLTNSP
jgi:hypothetical protein